MLAKIEKISPGSDYQTSGQFIGLGGANRILTAICMPKIQGFFDIPVDHLYASLVLFESLKKIDCENLTRFRRMLAV